MEKNRPVYPSADPSDYPTELQQNDETRTPRMADEVAARAWYPSADPSDYPIQKAAIAAHE